MDDKDTSLIKEDEIIVNISDSDINSMFADDITVIDTTSLPAYTIGATGSNFNYGNITINTSANGYNGSWSTMNSSSAGLHVTSNAEFDGDVKIKGVSILETLSKIEKRLSILRPDPEKLEHFEALKKAYEHYKTLEALCELPPEEEE